MNELESMLIRHEGIRYHLYKDTVGKLTIGVGRNIEDRGISHDEALYMLNTDIGIAKRELQAHFEWYNNLNNPRRCAMIDMCFNIGINSFMTFKKMIAAIENESWSEVKKQMLDSRWAKQVGDRATELADIMESGTFV